MEGTRQGWGLAEGLRNGEIYCSSFQMGIPKDAIVYLTLSSPRDVSPCMKLHFSAKTFR